MAKYKNREVTILKELPHPNGDLCEIEHKDLITLGKEIVMRKEVYVSPEEMKAIEAQRKPDQSNDFKVALVETKHTGSMVAPVKKEKI